ncbi:MAG TPA: response regulator [Polyangiaceae bacterium]|nr:response regulator [Polyangiaceae bacterium]
MSSNDLEKQTVLVIDDSEIILQVTRGALEAAGYRVITRSRAAGSVALLLHEKPHLVLLDVNMPTTSGDTLARVFGKAQSGVETIILLHSTLPAEVLRAKAEASGAHGYIQKTGDLYALVRAVNRWIKTHPSSGRLRSAAAATSPESGNSRSSSMQRVASRLVSDEPSPAEPPSRPARTDAAPASVVMFVDEDMAVLSEFRRLAQGLDSIVEFALSGTNAWRKIQGADAPDVVVCGVKLSDLPAAELYRRAIGLDAGWRDRFVFVIGAGETGHFSDAPTLRYPIDVRRMRDAIRGGAAHSPRRK